VLIADDTRLMCLVATASRLGPGGRRDWRRPGARAAGFPCSRARWRAGRGGQRASPTITLT